MIRRSYLFVPGDRPDRFEKAQQSGADAVILDLEDAVQSAHKDMAREAVASWLSPTRPVYVRINGVGTPWFEPDLEVVGSPGMLGVVWPKAERTEQVARVVARLAGGAQVLPLLETALGVWNARELAEAPRVERLAFGSDDVQLDTGISGEQEELLYARSRLVLASRIASIWPPLDGVTMAIDDLSRLRDDVARARRVGFGGKLCVHPKQVEPTFRSLCGGSFGNILVEGKESRNGQGLGGFSPLYASAPHPWCLSKGEKFEPALNGILPRSCNLCIFSALS